MKYVQFEKVAASSQLTLEAIASIFDDEPDDSQKQLFFNLCEAINLIITNQNIMIVTLFEELKEKKESK